MAPGAAAKVTSKSLNSAKELAAICNNIQIAKATFVLETASGIGIPVKIAEVVDAGNRSRTEICTKPSIQIKNIFL
jgi:hypothetical protein